MSITEQTFDDGSFSRYIVNADDLLMRVEDYDATGSLIMTVLYRYDAQGRNVERLVLDATGQQLRRLAFEYPASGAGCIYREYDANDTLVFTEPVDEAGQGPDHLSAGE